MKTSLKHFFLLIVTLSISTMLLAQKDIVDTDQTDEVVIQSVIDNLFDGMREGDSLKVHHTFRDDVRMLTTFTTKEGIAKVKEGSLSDFLNAVGTPHKEVWDERIDFIEIKIDGTLAQVWTEYKFYLDDQFLHCGVNAFQLIKIDGFWKIINLTDTRRKNTCFTVEDKKE